MKSLVAKLQIALLLVSGMLLILVGTSIIVSPVDFYRSNNIDVTANVNLLNELKAPAGLLLVAGLFMITAVFVKSRITIALRMATLIYLSYAATRLFSMVADGIPVSGLVTAAALEATIGLACLIVLRVGRVPQMRTI